MTVAALFTITGTKKQPKCTSIEEWIQTWYIYAMEYHSAIKRMD